MSFERTATPKAPQHTEPYTYTPSGDGTEGGNGGSILEWSVNMSPSRLLEQREKQGFERGLQEGEAHARRSFEQNLVAARGSIARALEEFKAQRESYFSRVEPEVVQLALSIARKVLHREAQMDPLLLTGVVHVALEKVDRGSRVRLRAHPDEIHFWNKQFSELAATGVAPEISGDPALNRGECVLETEVGSTQISLETQLKEIEQGFFDLLEQRPPVR